MSFFKDFKEDLSQAVNELMPEENQAQTITPAEPAAPVAEPVAAPAPAEPDGSAFNPDDLANMLKNIEDVNTNVPKEEPPVMPQSEFIAKQQEPSLPVFEQQPVAEQSEPVRQSDVEPVFPPEPVIPDDQKLTAAPIFGEPDVIKDDPINTVKNIKTMDVGVVISGMTIKGDIDADGSLDVKGKITGNITIEGRLEITGEVTGNSSAEEVFADGAKIVGDLKCNGTAKVGPSTVVRGNITATAAVIAGAVKGDIDVQGPVILDSTAIIMGNIKSKSIQINNGATIEGLCSQCYGDISPMSFFGDDKPEKPAAKATKSAK